MLRILLEVVLPLILPLLVFLGYAKVERRLQARKAKAKALEGGQGAPVGPEVPSAADVPESSEGAGEAPRAPAPSSPDEPGDEPLPWWAEVPWVPVVGAGLALMVAVLATVALTGGQPPGQIYVPAHMENGRLVGPSSVPR